MALFCAAIKRDPVSIFCVSFLNHVLLISCKISVIYRVKSTEFLIDHIGINIIIIIMSYR